jgi:hypothetical protein
MGGFLLLLTCIKHVLGWLDALSLASRVGLLSAIHLG